MAAYSDYPVELVGYYEERVNRLLWLIKWLLIIPHAIVLWFLSIPTILIPVAWVAIIIMGRYPSFLWGYHTGLLRWDMARQLLLLRSWRHRPVPALFLPVPGMTTRQTSISNTLRPCHACQLCSAGCSSYLIG